MAIGDHLSVDFGFYRHHGIDVGDGEVVHFGRGLHDIENAEIEKVSLETFCQGRPIKTVDSPLEFLTVDVADRALRRLGEKGYDLADNNCEHFAYWCRNGESRSRQSEFSETAVRQSFAACTRPLVRQSAARYARKLAVRIGSPPFSGARFLGLVGRSSKALWAADAAQAAVEVVATSKGKTQTESRCLGMGAGATVSACAGFVAAGRVGGVAGIAFWAIGQVVGQAAFEDGKKLFRRKTDPEQ